MTPGEYLVRCIAPYATQSKAPPALPTVHPLYWDAMAGRGYLTVREIAEATNRSFAGVRKQITVLSERGLLDEIRPPQMNKSPRFELKADLCTRRQKGTSNVHNT